MKARKLFLLGAVAVALIAIPAPVAGASPFASTFSVEGPTNFVGGNNATGSAEATCPPGSQLIGGGGVWSNTAEHLAITRSVPLATNQWSVTGRNWSGGGKTIRAVAQCGSPNPGGGFASTFIVEGPSNFIGGNFATGTAHAVCPSNSQLLGGGGTWSDLQRNNLGISQNTFDPYPLGSDTHLWVLAGQNFSGSGASIHAVALCGTPGPSGGFAQMGDFTGIPADTKPGQSAAIGVSCPAGMQMVTGGAHWGVGETLALNIAVTAPITGASGWRAIGTNGSSFKEAFYVAVRCGS